MKTFKSLSRSVLPLFALALGIAICTMATAQQHSNKFRVGVYDSRAVAVAWANSSEFKEAMKPVEAEIKKAREAKDEKRVKEIKEQMKLRQLRQHEQGFSTGSVIPIMEKVKDRLPDIAKQSGVQIVVSKWELNHQSPEVEVVDVTDKIVALFDVNERGLKWCKDIQSKKPLPMEQITGHMD